MKLTVHPAVSSRPVTQQGLEAWANNEVSPVLARLREAANFVGVERTDVVTEGDAVPVQLWESEEMPTDATWAIQARVAATGGLYSDQRRRATARSVAGTVTIAAQAAVWTEGTVPAVSFVVSGRKIQLLGADDGVNVHRFVSVVEVVEALAP